METLKLQFKYTQKEYIKAQRQYLIANKTMRRIDVVIAAVFLLFSICCLFLTQFSTISVILFVLALIVTASGSFVYILMPVLKFKQTEKYHEEYSLIFSKNKIEFRTPSVESQLQWDIYSELWESDEFYFLIQAPHMYALIPKRVFKDSNEKQLFMQLALSNLKSVKQIA